MIPKIKEIAFTVQNERRSPRSLVITYSPDSIEGPFFYFNTYTMSSLVPGRYTFSSSNNQPVSNNPFDFTNPSSTPVQQVNQSQNTNPMFDFNNPPQQTQPNTAMFNPVNEQQKPVMAPKTQPKPTKNYADLEQALNDPSILGQNKQPQPTTSMPSQIPQTNPMMNNNPMMNQAAFMNNMKQMMQGNPQMMQMMNNPDMQNMMYQMMMNYMNMIMY